MAAGHFRTDKQLHALITLVAIISVTIAAYIVFIVLYVFLYSMAPEMWHTLFFDWPAGAGLPSLTPPDWVLVLLTS